MFKSNLKKLSLIISISILIAGCANNATLLPHGNNKYTVVALSYSEDDAMKSAMNKANQVCSEKMLSVDVTKQNSVYQGVDKNQKAVMGIAGDVLNAISYNKSNNSSGFYPGSSRPESSRDDYKVTLDFTCEK
ncbi:MAG: hypothetical protein WCW01_04835 [Gammaproteobacteria bacterium]|jgi:hypothetical protein